MLQQPKNKDGFLFQLFIKTVNYAIMENANSQGREKKIKELVSQHGKVLVQLVNGIDATIDLISSFYLTAITFFLICTAWIDLYLIGFFEMYF